MRLLIVSNRLPVTLVKGKDGQYKISQSSGGLVSGLSAYLDSLKNTVQSSTEAIEFVWVGWPGISIPDEEKRSSYVDLLSEQNFYPVFIPQKDMNNFYYGFCNKTIWPLFHYFPSYAIYSEEFWETYKQINRKFFEKLSEIIQPGDFIWIHDYHLMLLPKLIRMKFDTAKIGFFLHIPFPQYEIFSLLPQAWRTEILEGILGADIAGFHTQDYMQYFLRCILRILGYKNSYGRIILPDRSFKAATFPMGIDYKKFAESVFRKKHQTEKNKIKKILNYEKVILSIDRLDYTKGILNRLLAFEIFLERNPEWNQRLCLLLQIIPSRVGVDQYDTLKHLIDAHVGRINGKFSTLTWAPISYRYGFLDFDSLTALYDSADIMLVTPLRDGMNLIAKEYLACRSDKTGVLILSEMAGASKELGESIIINPNYKEEIASALERAVKMSTEEQVHKNEVMQDRLKKYDVTRWAESFIESMAAEKDIYETEDLCAETKIEIVDRFFNSLKGILFLDYDGTLVPFKSFPEMSYPDEEVMNLLEGLGNLKNLDVVLISGRDKATLEKWFGNLNVCLVAEHGAWLFKKKQWQTLKSLTATWKQLIYPIFELHKDLVPGSFIEEKEFSIVWHYRNSNQEIALRRKREFLDQLLNFISSKDIEVITGKKNIEVRSAGINKGMAAQNFLSKTTYDFVAAVGDDQTDEDLFHSLPPDAFIIKVGDGNTYARYRVKNHKETILFLRSFLNEIPIGGNPSTEILE